jgi:hypothetical protein
MVGVQPHVRWNRNPDSQRVVCRPSSFFVIVQRFVVVLVPVPDQNFGGERAAPNVAERRTGRTFAMQRQAAEAPCKVQSRKMPDTMDCRPMDRGLWLDAAFCAWIIAKTGNFEELELE